MESEAEYHKEFFIFLLEFLYKIFSKTLATFESFSSIKAKAQSLAGSANTTANHAQFWFRRFRFGNFDDRDTPPLEGNSQNYR